MVARSRRTQFITAVVGVLFIYFLFFNGDYPSSSSGTTDFRKTTEKAIARKHGILRGELSDEDLTAKTNQELQAILDNKKGGEKKGEGITGGLDLDAIRGQKGKEKPKAEGLDPKKGKDSEKEKILDTDEVSVAGRKTMPKQSPQTDTDSSEPKEKSEPKYPINSKDKKKDKSAVGSEDDADDHNDEEVAFNGNKIESAADPGEEMAREELQSILKKSPIIIFSKSYCPYSKRAKSLLLHSYTITPTPYVVELDLMTKKVPLAPKPNSHKHPNSNDEDEEAPTLGRKLQDLLATLTNRRTVPNIMINSQSLGGSDEVMRLDQDGTLIETIKRMGGKRIVGIEKVGEGD